MDTVVPQHSLSFRREVLSPLFDLIHSAESCCIIGASSIGKTRLLDFVMRPDVQDYYLKKNVSTTKLFRVDMNRIREWSDIAFFELLMSTIATSCSQFDATNTLQKELIDLMSKIISERNEAQGLRFVELAVDKLCKQYKFSLCFIFDEFDNGYRNLSANVLANLRGIRDRDKDQISYVLMLRNWPGNLRSPVEIEGFYEIVSRNIIGLKPYSRVDALEIIQQFKAQRRYPIAPNLCELFYAASGGHPGLIHALFSLMHEYPESSKFEDPSWVLGQERIKEECRKLWESLSENEKSGLLQFTKGQIVPSAVLQHLRVKGILQPTQENEKIFSPIFDIYVRSK